MEAGGLGLGPVDDRGPDVGLQGEVDVDHAEVVGVAAGTAGGVLAGAEVTVLLGFQDDLAGPLS
jgi:hypothetical protein